MSGYHDVYAAWKKDPEAFWANAAKDVSWYKLWDKVLDPYAGLYGRWFAGAECNTAYNCLDRHVEARPRRADGADLRQPRHRHEAQLSPTPSCATRSPTLAGVLRDLGVGKGDRVISTCR